LILILDFNEYCHIIYLENRFGSMFYLGGRYGKHVWNGNHGQGNCSDTDEPVF
jgi:hypothetical protein